MVQLKSIPSTDTDFDTWLGTLPVGWSASQVEVVRRAYALATDPGVAVADLLADLRMDHEVVSAALVQQAVATDKFSLSQVEAQLGSGVARLVDGVIILDVIGDLHSQGQHEQRQLESLRKMLLAMARDVRVVLLKLAVHLHEMRGVNVLSREEQRRLARETLDIFAPLANRLGIGRIKWELEDLALRCLDPEAYKQLAKSLEQRRVEREHYIAAVVQRLQQELDQAGIRAEVSGRVKHIYSIWRKMQRKQLPFEQIFDVRAVRIMTHSIADCYAALGVVHALWSHIRKEFDDYIANPKSNGYQSLHTAVIGPEGKNLEVQIRTWDMHQYAELGIAAHWRYKEGGGGRGSTLEQQIVWLRQMLEWKDDTMEAGDFLDRFKAEAFQDRVYAVTPRGAIVEMIQGATPLDFAYHIHTEVGHRCRGAKINGRIVPLTYELRNGDQVEILTTKGGMPSRDWLLPHLGYLKTSRAQAKVRAWFKEQDREKSIAAGRAALDREFQRLDVNSKEVNLQELSEKLNFTKPEELFAALGYGTVTVGQVIARAQSLILPPPAETLRVSRKARLEEGGSGIKIRGVGRLLTHIANCCKPVPFEPIAGFITHGRGVTIHRQDCPNLLNLLDRKRERIIEVNWGQGKEDAGYAVDIRIEAYDRSGLLRDITSVLVHEKVNVLASNTFTDPETAMARMDLTLEIHDVEQLSRVLDRIGQIPNVAEVRRRSQRTHLGELAKQNE